MFNEWPNEQYRVNISYYNLGLEKQIVHGLVGSNFYMTSADEHKDNNSMTHWYNYTQGIKWSDIDSINMMKPP